MTLHSITEISSLLSLEAQLQLQRIIRGSSSSSLFLPHAIMTALQISTTVVEVPLKEHVAFRASDCLGAEGGPSSTQQQRCITAPW